jgi:hypothetical protein
VVHGDVSPGNVLLDLDGRPVLGDLGLGHVVGDLSPGVWGTDGYVAPEVLLGGDPTPASDVYALGAVGWLCLSGTVPGPPGLRPELAQVCLAGEGSAPVVAALAAAVSAEPTDRPGAHELAWLLFGAAEAEPLRLVAGDDEVSAVTYRLRAAAGRPPSQARSGRRRWLPARKWRAARRGGGRHAGASVRRLSREAAAAGLLAVLLVALLVVTVAVLGAGEGTAPARATVGAAGPAGEPEAAPAGANANTSRADPRTDAAAPRTRPTELLRVLADARAAAWREATPSLLGEADAPRSAVAVRDSLAVAEVARAGVRYTGLHYTVAEVATVSATPDRAVLRARVDSGTYAVTAATDSTWRPAQPGTPVLVDLVRTDVGWRMSDLRPAS